MLLILQTPFYRKNTLAEAGAAKHLKQLIFCILFSKLHFQLLSYFLLIVAAPQIPFYETFFWKYSEIKSEYLKCDLDKVTFTFDWIYTLTWVLPCNFTHIFKKSLFRTHIASAQMLSIAFRFIINCQIDVLHVTK